MDPLPLRVYVLPVSGGALVCQLAFLIELYKARIKIDNDRTKIYPHLVLGSSGGNISGYMGLTGGWSEAGIIRMAKMMERDMFLLNWWPENLDFLPSSTIGVFQNSLYRPGYGIKSLFRNNLTPARAQYIEIWTGTYNVTKRKSQFFCNKKEGQTFINKDRFEKERVLYNCEPLTYTNGDLDLLAEITIASASIPVLVENKPIHDCIYADGGTAYSSPLSVFASELLRIVTGNSEITTLNNNVNLVEEDIIANKSKNNNLNKNNNLTSDKYSLQLIYFSCYDLCNTTNDKLIPTNITRGAEMTINTMITTLEILDRSKSIDLIKYLAEDNEVKHFHYPSLTTSKLSDLIKELETKKHYVLNLYPQGNPSIDLLNFNGQIVIDKIREIQTLYGGHVWYTE